MKKHFIPLLLALVLLLGLFPGAVFAAGDHDCEALLDDAYWKLFGKVGYPKLMTEFTGNLYNPYEDDFIPWDVDSDYADTNVIEYMHGLLGSRFDEVELTIVDVVKDLFYYYDDEDEVTDYSVIGADGTIHYDAVNEDNYTEDIEIDDYVYANGAAYEVSFALSCHGVTYDDTIECTIVVPAHLTTRQDRLKMAADYALAKAAVPTTVTEDLTLPRLVEDTYVDENGFYWQEYMIDTAWTSDHPEVISASGKVTPPQNTTTVTLTLRAFYMEGYYESAGYLLDPGPFGDDEVRTVTVTVPGVGHTVAVENSYASESGAGVYKTGDTVTIHAGERAHYVFVGWRTLDANVTFANAQDADTSFVMPDGDVTVEAAWREMTIFEEPRSFPYFYGRPDEVAPKKDSKTGTTAADSSTEEPSADNTAATEAELPFTDVTESDSFAADVRFCYARGLLEGTAAETFAPYDGMTRAMLVTVLWRMENEPVVDYAMAFADVAEGEWYSEAIRWAASEQIVLGYDNGTFGTNDPITREQFFTILYRYANDHGCDTTAGGMAIREYDDCDTVSAYASEAMTWAVNCGLVPQRDGMLAPQETLLRFELAMSLHSFFVGYSL